MNEKLECDEFYRAPDALQNASAAGQETED